MSRYAFIAACLLIGLHGFDRAESGRVRMQYDQLSQADVATQARPDRVNIVDGEDMETGDPQALQQDIQHMKEQDMREQMADEKMHEYREKIKMQAQRSSELAWLEDIQAQDQKMPLQILPGDWVKVVRGEGEGSTGVVYKLKNNGHLKVCLGDDEYMPFLPHSKMTGWGHDTSHCLKVIEAADRDLQETEQSLTRKIKSMEFQRKMKRINSQLKHLTR